ncbi:MAG: beta-lactamase family protein [Planctomycetes bacterium]|nr:beta-lactamase family protein [Planctomycetota bacterium]
MPRTRGLRVRLPLLLLLLLALGLCRAALAGAGETPEAQDERSTRIDALFASCNEKTPGCSVLVVLKGEVVHAKGYGMADLERKVKMGPAVPSRLDSTTKPFTALGILILAERGTLAYDDPASRFIPELKARYGDGIKVRHLLNHTSGLPDYYEAMDHFPKDRMPVCADGAKVYEKWGEPRFVPGERFEYSNPGYEMLGLIIERAAERSYAAFMKDDIFAPLGMDASLVLEHPEKHFENRTYGYQPAPGRFVLNDDHPLNTMFGAGGIYTTLEDMYKWDQALESGSLVKKETLEEAFTPATLNSGEQSSYGFGWGVGERKGRRCLSHGGGWVGFRTEIARYPEDRLTVVLMANRIDLPTGKRAKEIADLYLAEKKDV